MVVRIGAAAIVALAGFGSACGESDPTSLGIAQARNTLEAMAKGPPKTRALLEQKYNEVVTALTPLTQGGASAESESVAFVQGLLAEALAGQGELGSALFREADAELMRSVAAASATVNLYIEQRALEASLTGYDPEADITRFEAMAVERRADLTKSQAELAATTRERDAFVAQAEGLENRAQGLREAEGHIRERAQAASASQRMPFLREAQHTRREWETLIRQAEELRAQTTEYVPRLIEIELRIAQSQRRLLGLDQAKSSAGSRASSLREESASAGRAAEEAGEAARLTIEAALAAMNEGTRPTFEQASGKLGQALSRASGVRGAAARAGAQVSTGTIAHALGSVQREQGESLARVATLLEHAAGATPPLAGASEYAASAQRIREEAKALLIQAAESYEKAIAALGAGGGGGAGETSERAQRVAKALEEIRREILGEPAPEPEAAPLEETQGEAEAPIEPPASEVVPAPDAQPEPDAPASPDEPAPESR